MSVAGYESEDEIVRAAEVAVEAQWVSTSLIQRRLRVGFAKAFRIIEELERRGVVGPADGAKPRSVLIPPPGRSS